MFANSGTSETSCLLNHNYAVAIVTVQRTITGCLVALEMQRGPVSPATFDRCVAMETRPAPPTTAWYKERLKTKYLKNPLSKPTLDTNGWHFSVDDLRNGWPQQVPSEARTDASPVIFRGTSNLPLNRRPKKHYSKEQAYFSKRNIQQQICTGKVAALEEKFEQHPLALYPHYVQSMPLELFDQVLSVLDPEMCIDRASGTLTSVAGHVDGEDEEYKMATNEAEMGRCKEGTPDVENSLDGHIASSKNPLEGLWVNENGAKEDQRGIVDPLSSLLQDKCVEEVVRRFCDWLTPLGGDRNGTVTSLPRCTETVLCKDPEPKKRELRAQTLRHGVRSQNPKTWREREENELLRDSSGISEELEFQSQTTEKDELLRQMYVTQAFTQYVISKGLRMPKFLSNLSSEEEQNAWMKGGSNAVGSAQTCKRTTASSKEL
ncbi:protein FAM47E [Lampris incognitus]|uniref:protein FAM47E n=1 Tax=Lampris incognitus TaxID=2546036 RepID=UPI0024B530E9|nr:protein FAM47E [Lampris incognitus]